MKSTLFAIAVGLASLSMPAFAQDARDEWVQFARGASGATIKETITGYQSVNYKLGAKAGQSMVVILTTDNTANYFNIYVPGKGPGDEAMFIGSTEGGRYEGALPADGEYTVAVYMMRSAARRNEKANYTLEISIDGAAKASSSEAGSVAWPADTDTAGDLPCSTEEPSFKRSCAFKVKRNTFGATV